jgi:uncharacterized FlgJ-related protein
MFTSNLSPDQLVATFAHIESGLAAKRLARRINDMALTVKV